MLQNLANKPSYSKEAYMMTLNPFVENNKARINQFLNNLCEVGDFYDTLEVGLINNLLVSLNSDYGYLF
jgi:Ras GTPase-activating-like protein IQGAP2/3